MTAEKADWLTTAKSNTKSNEKKAIIIWIIAMVNSANIPEESQSVAVSAAMAVFANGGLRGEISDRWKEIGFTNEQFNFELFV